MNKKKKSMKLLLPIIVVVVIAIVISLVFVFNRKDTKAYDDKLEQAQKYVEEMDYKRAETAYLEAIKIDSKQPKAYLKLADVYVADEQADKAIKILNKGLKNVDKDDQKEIIEKKKKIEKQTQNQDVINNGGNHITYNGKTYYWKYSSDSLYSAPMHAMYFGNYIRFENDIENELVCLDKNGKEKTIYEGVGYGRLWVYNQRIYSKKADYELISIKLDGTDEKSYSGISNINAVSDEGLIVSTKNNSIALLEKNDEIEDIKEEAAFCYYEDDKLYYQVTSDGEYYYENLDFRCIDITGKNDSSLAKLSSKDYTGEEYYDHQMSIPIQVDCVQIVGDDIYFQYGGYDGSSLIYQGGKIAKVKKDGTGFTNIKDVEMDSATSFTVYKNGSDVEIKTGGALNKPFCEYEYSSSSTTVSIYTNENSNKKELISKDEYKNIDCDDITGLDYTGDELYFIAIQLDETSNYVQKCSFYKKDLKTNKLEKQQELLLNN